MSNMNFTQKRYRPYFFVLRRFDANVKRGLSNIQNLICRDWKIFLAIFIFTLLLSSIAILKHYAFKTNAWDLGIFEQSLWTTINAGKLLWSTPDMFWNLSGCFLGIHFSPILFLVLPIYFLFQRTETLLILQSFVLGISAYPLYLLAKDKIGTYKSMIVCLLYLAYPPILGVGLFDFHVQAFLPALYMFALYFLKKRAYKKFLFTILLSLFVIEIIPPLISIMLIPYMLREGKLSEDYAIIKRLCLLVLFLAITFIPLSLGIISLINPHQTPTQLSHLSLAPYIPKLLYVVGIFAPVAFLSFLDIRALLPAFAWLLPSLLIIEPMSYYVPVGFQYPAFMVAFIFLSFVNSLEKLMLKRILRGKMRGLIAVAIVAGFVSSLYAASTFPAFHALELPIISQHEKAICEVIKLIPNNASLSVQPNIFPHVARRIEVYPYYKEDVEFILVDISNGWYKSPLPPLSDIIDPSIRPIHLVLPSLLKERKYGLLVAINNIFLFKKDYSGEVILLCNRGFLGEFYVNGELIFKGIYLSLDYDWYYPLPSPYPVIEAGNFEARFYGFLHVPTSGWYEFKAEGGGTIRVFIDGKKILDVFTGYKPALIWLGQGVHKISVHFTSHSDLYGLHVYWRRLGSEVWIPISSNHVTIREGVGNDSRTY